jgi:hypothetical protein
MKHRGSWEENSSAKVQWQQASIPRDDQSRQHTHFRNDLFPKKKRSGKRTVSLQKSAFFAPADLSRENFSDGGSHG